jgi:peptidoglycan/LPS O-acetylase OafA/YrhL
MDALGLGALLAMSIESPIHFGITRNRLTSVSRNIGLPGFLGLLILYVMHKQEFLTPVFLYFAAALAFTWIVSTAASGFQGTIGKLMTLPPLLYLGRISYGLYLYHWFAPNLVKQTWLKIGVPLTEFGMPVRLVDFAAVLSRQYATKLTAFIVLVLYSLVAVGMASLSWYLWERPATTLRRFVRYPSGLNRNKPDKKTLSAA